MHNHVANSGRKALLKQIFSVFLIFTLYFNSFNSAYASTSIGGWTLTQQIAQGASLALSASKNAIINGANVLKTSTAKITPNASQVAKILRGGAAGYALSIAVEQTIGSAVDWILDPANNQIIYKLKEDLSKPPSYCQNYYQASVSNPSTVAYGCSINEVAQNLCKKHLQHSNVKSCTFSNVTETSFKLTTDCKVWNGTCYGIDSQITPQRKTNPYYDPNAQNQEKTVSLDTIAARVISNAETSTNNDHKVGAQVATTAAAQDMLANDAATQADVETQLNTNAKTQTSEQATGETKPNEANPEITDISLSFPAFCGWAPSVCEAANVVINFPTTLTNWWTTATTSISDSWTWTKARYEAAVTSISDFFKNEPDETDNTDLPVQEIPLQQLETNAFTATAGCPEPIPIQIKIGVEGTAHISYEPICQFAEKWSFIAPLIGFLSGAMIIVGVGRKGEDSEI